MDYKKWRSQIKPDKTIRNYQHFDDALNLNSEKIFQKIINILQDIIGHQFLPFLKRDMKVVRFRKNKDGNILRSLKVRPIMYAAHVDAHIYSYYNHILSEKYEDFLREAAVNDNVIAYRKVEIRETAKGKSNIHFAKEVFDYIQKRDAPVVITQDIESFFDKIDHKILKNRLCLICKEKELDNDLYKIIKSLTKYRYVQFDDFKNKKIKKLIKKNGYAIYKILKDFVRQNQTNKGIPQGSPMSGLLANIYLVSFDHAIKTTFPDVFYRRYSDDLIFVCKNSQRSELLKFIDRQIKEHFLSINPEKSFISYFENRDGGIFCSEVTDGLENKLGRDYVAYLGFEFNGKSILLRKNTIQKLKHKQADKAKKQLLNTQSQIRRKPKKLKSAIIKHRSNYFKKTLSVIDNPGIKNQILGVVRDRNKVGKT